VASQLAEDRAMGETSVVVAKVDATQEKYLQGVARPITLRSSPHHTCHISVPKLQIFSVFDMLSW
jgi:hypothetical protein